MKKLLLASAALALSAGLASAQGVTLSGDARMGLVYDQKPELDDTANVSKWKMTSRARVTFTLSGQTDTGLNFGASFRADQAGAAVGNTSMTGGTVFISGAFGTLTMGDAAGAARHNVGDLDFTSLTGLGDQNEMIYLDRLQQGSILNAFTIDDDTDGGIADRRTAARYDYSIDDFTVSVSLDQFRKFEFGSDPDDPDTEGDSSVRTTGFALGASYDFGMGSIAVGYEDYKDRFRGEADIDDFRASHAIIGADVTFDGVTVKAIYGRAGRDLGTLLRDANLSRDQYGLSVSATFDEVTVSAFGNRDFLRSRTYGIGASYDLGGGARVVGSVARTSGFEDPFAFDHDDDDVVRNRVRRTRADFGIAMTF